MFEYTLFGKPHSHCNKSIWCGAWLTNTQRKLNVDDDVTTVLDYGNGATGVFITCTHDVIGTDRLEITGDKGKILVEDSSKLTLTRLNESETSMNNKMNWSEAQEIFKGKALDDIYSRETFEFNSIWGEQHINALICCSPQILLNSNVSLL